MRDMMTDGGDIDLPELATMVAIPGATRHAEVGGQGCQDSGVMIALLVFDISDH